MKSKRIKFNWRKYFFETLSMFIAVISAFALNNWNQERRDYKAEKEIIKAVKLAVKNDLQTIKTNKAGYKLSKKSCAHLRDLIDNKPINQDSIHEYYTHVFANFIFLPNKTGYEGLASKGLDIIKDDLLRARITYYYNYYFDLLVKFEEQSDPEAIYLEINTILAKYMEFDEAGKLSGVTQPIDITEAQRKKIYSYLWQIEANRDQKILVYQYLEEQITTLQSQAESILETMD
ncbi:hypothetical protein KORDIASMS9_01233 [Kordia sp. SMS9]|uniref:DUF6090 family protein n=1 Tax=Kordia sp. SMS9 TaxID=2282170 RepID=UPI000E10D588|nr:DUF6090 family protein [Kordia sp. SMS9]AXG69014.1 hypothetical protein KORDIASMS9_01233 [Kordia sp. SMS9]